MILDGIQMFLGIICLVIAVLQFFGKRRLIKKFIFLFFFAFGYHAFYYGIYLSKIIFDYPFLYATHLVCLFIFAPALYFIMRIMIDEDFQFKKRHYLHFVPLLIRTADLLPVVLASTEEKLIIMKQKIPLYFPEEVMGSERFLVASVYAFVYTSAYVFMICRKINWKDVLANFRNKIHPKDALFWLVLMIVLVWASHIAVVVCAEKRYAVGVKTAGIIMTISLIMMYLFSLVFPYMLQLGILVLTKPGFSVKNYVKSRLKNVNLTKVEKKLHYLMNEKKVFNDEKLTLKSLAGMLDISHLQFSEYCNTILNMSFNDYLHNLRVEEARRLLIEKKSMSVTRIGYESGFSSESNFYSVFKKITGQTPENFRKENHKKKS